MLSTTKDVLFTVSQQQQGAMPWGAWFVLIVLVIVFFIFLWERLGVSKGGDNRAMPFRDAQDVKEQPKPQPSAPAKPQAIAPMPAVADVVPMDPDPVSIKPDDLTLIEGIGPKIATTLQGAGIHTFAQLAATDVTTLEKMLKGSKLRLANPASWPEQAKLLADGKKDELKALQATLKAGRRA